LERIAKNNCFASFGLRDWLAAVYKLVVLWAAFLLSL